MDAGDVDKLLQNFQRKLRIFEEKTNVACQRRRRNDKKIRGHNSENDFEYFDLDESLKDGYLPCTKFKLDFRHVKKSDLKMAVVNGQTHSSESEDGICIQQAILNAKQRMLSLVHEENNFKKDIKEIQGIFYNLIAELDRLDQGGKQPLEGAGGDIRRSADEGGGTSNSSRWGDNSFCGSEVDVAALNDSRTRTSHRRRNSMKMGQRVIQSPKNGAPSISSSSGGSTTSDCDSSGSGAIARQRSGVRLGMSIVKRRNSFNQNSSTATTSERESSLPPKPSSSTTTKPDQQTLLNHTYVVANTSPKNLAKKQVFETDIDQTFSPQLTSTMVNNSPNISLMGCSAPPSPASPIRTPTTADSSSYDSDANAVPGRRATKRGDNLYKLHVQRMRRTPIRSPNRNHDPHSPGILKASPAAEKLYKKKNETQNKRRNLHTSYASSDRCNVSYNSVNRANETLPPKTPVKSPRVTFVDEVYKRVNSRASTSSESSDLEYDYTTAYKPVPLPQLNPLQKTSSMPSISLIGDKRRRGAAAANCSSDSSTSDFSSDSSCSKCTTIDRSNRAPHPTPEDTIDDSSFMAPPRRCFNTPNSTCSTVWDSECTSVLTEVGLALEACDESDAASNRSDYFADLDHVEKEFRKCRDNGADETYAKYMRLINDFERQMKRSATYGNPLAGKTGKNQHCQNHDVHMALGEPCSLYLEETLTLLESSKFNVVVDQLSESGFESTHNIDSSLDSTVVTDASSIEGSAKGSFRRAANDVDMRRMIGMMQYAKQLKRQVKRDDAGENTKPTVTIRKNEKPNERCQKLSLPSMTRPRVPASLEVTINSTPDMSAVKTSPEMDATDCCLLDAEHTMMEHNFQSCHGRDYCESLSSGSSDSFSTTITEKRQPIPTNTPESSYEPSPEFPPRDKKRIELGASPTSTSVSSDNNSRLQTRPRNNLRQNIHNRKNVVSNASYQNAISQHPCKTPGLSPIVSPVSDNSSNPAHRAPMNTPTGSQETTPAKAQPQGYKPGSIRSHNTRGLRKQLKFNTPKFKSPLKRKKYRVNEKTATETETERLPRRAVSMKAKKVKDSLYLARHNRRKSELMLPPAHPPVPPPPPQSQPVNPAELTAEEKELAYKKKKGLKKKLKLFSNYFNRKDRDSYPELQMLAQL
ncbi:uncharacterized protein LOC141905252 [Tubulanus polymorphus]|uniref:uncharacterized protein LOC141905252 n=1 Tax=Tubulanus polymorphus TaxID=672921 RepID=UPI003DA32565